MTISAGVDIISPFDNSSTNCGCTPGFTYQVSGGELFGGGATISGGRQSYTPSGGAVCGGTALVSTNKLWDAYSVVLHLVELSDGISGEYLNSACNILNATGKSIGTTGHYPQRTSSIFYKSQEMDRTCYISVPDDNFNNQTSLTISGWVRNTTSFMDGIYFNRGVDNPKTGEGVNIILGKSLDQTIYASIKLIGQSDTFSLSGVSGIQSADIIYTINGVNPLTSGCWYHVATTWDYINGILSIYLNGALEGQLSGIPYNKFMPNLTGSFIGRPVSVDICEVRVSTDVKSSNWIYTEYLDVCSPASVYNCGQSIGIYN